MNGPTPGAAFQVGSRIVINPGASLELLGPDSFSALWTSISWVACLWETVPFPSILDVDYCT